MPSRQELETLAKAAGVDASKIHNDSVLEGEIAKKVAAPAPKAKPVAAPKKTKQKNPLMRFTPTQDGIQVIPEKTKERTDSGIVIAEDWRTLPLTGKVVSVGPDVTDIKEGDVVIYNRYSAIRLEDDSHLTNEKQILGVINV